MAKIKFQISQTTELDPEIITGLILLKLKDKKYDVLEVTRNNVKFYDNPWVWRWSFQQAERLDGGDFKIDTTDNCTSVTLNYYFNLWPSLIGVSIPVIGTIIAGFYDGAAFFIIFILIALSVQALISKNVARNMLSAILTKNIMN